MHPVVQTSLASLDTMLANIEKALARVTEQDIWVRPKEEINSIGNLCMHLAGSEYLFISTIIGGKPNVRQRSNEFTASGGMEAAQLLQRLKEAREASRGVLAPLTELDLARVIQMPDTTTTVVPEPGPQKSVLAIVISVVEHYSYHTGQIVYQAKQLQQSTEHILKWRH